MKAQVIDALREKLKVEKLESYYAKLEEENDANLEKLAEHPMVLQLVKENAELKTKLKGEDEEKDEEDEEDEDEDEDTKNGEWSQEIKETRYAMCQRYKELLLIAKSRSGKPEDTHALWKKLLHEDEEYPAYKQKLRELVAKAQPLQEKEENEA